MSKKVEIIIKKNKCFYNNLKNGYIKYYDEKDDVYYLIKEEEALFLKNIIFKSVCKQYEYMDEEVNKAYQNGLKDGFNKFKNLSLIKRILKNG